MRRARRHGMRLARGLLRILMLLLAAFGAAALAYSTLEPDWLRLVLAAILAVVAGGAALGPPLRRGFPVWAVSMLAFFAWYWLADRPRNDRVWEPEYATPATATRDGDVVTIHDIRNFTYHPDGTGVPAYYDARFRLDQLATVDLITSYWAGENIAHVFLSFGFTDGQHIAFSIETRRRLGATYSAIAGFFHHYELFYVAADERDLIGVRTDIRRERVYLYRVRMGPERRVALFLSYVDKLNELARRPEWYNTLSDNCTTGILARAAQGGAAVRYDWRILLSGHAAEYAAMAGILNPSLSYPMLRRESRITRPPGASIGPGFSDAIRAGLPL